MPLSVPRLLLLLLLIVALLLLLLVVAQDAEHVGDHFREPETRCPLRIAPKHAVVNVERHRLGDRLPVVARLRGTCMHMAYGWMPWKQVRIACMEGNRAACMSACACRSG